MDTFAEEEASLAFEIAYNQLDMMVAYMVLDIG